MAKSEADILAMALEPFATYFKQMEAYGVFHRGKMLPDEKVMAYSQTEMGTSAAITIGDFRRALEAMEKTGRKPGVYDGGFEKKKMERFRRACGTPTENDELFI